MTAARSSGPEQAALVLAAARGWLGTPYRHQASCRGVGADCLGLVRGVWREVLGAEPGPVPAYTPDWAEADGTERMLRAARGGVFAGGGQNAPPRAVGGMTQGGGGAPEQSGIPTGRPPAPG
ncbi:MAG: peptidase, partial [Pseudomonadota bacterium]